MDPPAAPPPVPVCASPVAECDSERLRISTSFLVAGKAVTGELMLKTARIKARVTVPERMVMIKDDGGLLVMTMWRDDSGGGGQTVLVFLCDAEKIL